MTREARCLACLEPMATGLALTHPDCARRIVAAPTLPEIDIDLARLHTVGLAMVGRSSLSGVQRKIGLRIDHDRSTLRLEVGAGSYILKPQAQTFPNLPENEHVTLLMAASCGIEVAPSCLIPLKDDSLALLTRRLDRATDGRKFRQEDFCQLAAIPSKEKYDGSAELCVRLIRRYASEPGIDALRLFRLLLFCWWTGDGDAHLKNLSLLAEDQGIHRLSPAYDLLSTRLVIPDDPLALPVGGKSDGLTRRCWLQFGAYAGLPPKLVLRELGALVSNCDSAMALVDRSFLPDEMKRAYQALLQQRAAILAGA